MGGRLWAVRIVTPKAPNWYKNKYNCSMSNTSQSSCSLVHKNCMKITSNLKRQLEENCEEQQILHWYVATLGHLLMNPGLRAVS